MVATVGVLCTPGGGRGERKISRCLCLQPDVAAVATDDDAHVRAKLPQFRTLRVWDVKQ